MLTYNINDLSNYSLFCPIYNKLISNLSKHVLKIPWFDTHRL